MLFRTAAIVAASLPVAFSLPAYKIPSSFNKFLALNTCTYPEAFDIQNFTTWTSAPGSNASSTVDFGYFDKSTNLQTSCHYNATSPNVGKPGLASRYACDNAIVEFIWQNGTLTMIETACPSNTGSERWEAAGTAKPVLDCAATSCGYTYGDGKKCTAVITDIQANFTSLEPSPS